MASVWETLRSTEFWNHRHTMKLNVRKLYWNGSSWNTLCTHEYRAIFWQKPVCLCRDCFAISYLFCVTQGSQEQNVYRECVVRSRHLVIGIKSTSVFKFVKCRKRWFQFNYWTILSLSINGRIEMKAQQLIFMAISVEQKHTQWETN